jgi:hypothetical protein
MIVTNEVTMDSFLTDSFLHEDPESAADAALEAMRASGVDPTAFGLTREVLIERHRQSRAMEPIGPQVLPVQPQARRRARRSVLNDEIKTTANAILQALGQGRGMGRIARLHGGRSNLEAVTRLVNERVNSLLGIASGRRRELSTNEIERARDALDSIADEIQAELRGRLV